MEEQGKEDDPRDRQEETGEGNQAVIGSQEEEA